MRNLLHEHQVERGSRRRVKSGRCSVLACSVETTEGKPYCVDHIDRMPYVASLAQSQEHTNETREAVKARRKYGPKAPRIAV